MIVPRILVVLLFGMVLWAQGFCTLGILQIYLGEQKGALLLIGKRKKLREVSTQHDRLVDLELTIVARD